MSIKVWQKLSPVLIPLGAILLAFLFGAVVLFALGANPLQAYGALIEGAFGNTNAFADTLVKATPSTFCCCWNMCLFSWRRTQYRC